MTSNLASEDIAQHGLQLRREVEEVAKQRRIGKLGTFIFHRSPSPMGEISLRRKTSNSFIHFSVIISYFVHCSHSDHKVLLCWGLIYYILHHLKFFVSEDLQNVDKITISRHFKDKVVRPILKVSFINVQCILFRAALRVVSWQPLSCKH